MAANSPTCKLEQASQEPQPASNLTPFLNLSGKQQPFTPTNDPNEKPTRLSF